MVSVGDFKIDAGKCFIIAEIGVNHNGDINNAIKLIDVAVRCGADAVKFQSFKAESLAIKCAVKAEYQRQNTDENESQYEMLKKLELSENDHKILFDYCQNQNIKFLSSPFEEASAKFLNELGVEAFKLPSGELTNLPFLSYIASFSKPMIVSTGMANLAEVEEAVKTIKKSGNSDMVLLHCVSNYPAAPENVNLRAMLTMKKAFGLPVGYSDHGIGNEISWGSVALGGCVIEKHITLDKNMEGPDHSASMEENELKELVDGIRKIELALGNGKKEPALSEKETADVARKSIVAAKDIPEGSTLTVDALICKRPGTGLPPKMLYQLIGKKAKAFIQKDSLINLSDCT